jgi:hypothetical protein
MKTIKDWPGARTAYATWTPADGDEAPYANFFDDLEFVDTGGVVAVYRLVALKRAVRKAPVAAKTVLKPISKRKRK